MTTAIHTFPRFSAADLPSGSRPAAQVDLTDEFARKGLPSPNGRPVAVGEGELLERTLSALAQLPDGGPVSRLLLEGGNPSSLAALFFLIDAELVKPDVILAEALLHQGQGNLPINNLVELVAAYGRSASPTDTTSSEVSVRDRLIALAVRCGGFEVEGADGYRPAHHAAAHGNLAALDALQESGAKLLAPNSSGVTALHLAARHAQHHAVAHLIKAGVRDAASAVDDQGRQPLHMLFMDHDASLRAGPAGLRSVRSIMAQLCFNGGSMEAKDQFGNTALDYAARAGSAAHIQVISQMLVGRQELHADLIKGALLVGNDAALGELFRLAPDAVKHRVIVDVAVARHYSLSRLASVAGFDFKVIGNDGKTAAQTLVSRIQDAVAQGGEDRAARKEIFGIVCLADCGASIDDAVLHDVLKGALTTAARFDSNATNIRFLMKSSLWKRCDTLAKNFLDAQAVQMRQGTLSECEAGFKAAKNLVVAGVIPNEKTGRDILEMASARRDSTLIKQLAEYGFEPTPEAPRRAPPAGPAYRAHEAYSERDIDMYVGLMKSAIGLPDRRSLLQMYQAAPAHVKHRLLVEVAMDKRYSLRRLVALTGGDFHLHDAEGKTPAQALARRIEEAVRQGIEPGTATLELFGIVRMADRGAPIDDAVLGVALEAALLTAARRELNACNIQYLMNSSLGKRCKGRAQEFLADCVRGIGQGSMRKRMAAFDSAKRLLLAGLAPDEPVARALLKAAAQLQDEMLINKLAELGITQTSPDLFETIREGDVQQLKQHLAEGADLHQKDPQGNTLLHAAILRGDVAMVKALGQFGPHYLEEDSARRTPIALAQTSGTEQIEDALQAAALGLPEIPQSRQDALKAFKQQALNWHPDKKPDAPRQMMQLVNAARDYWFARAI